MGYRYGIMDAVHALLICYSVTRAGVNSPGAGLARMITSLGRWWHPAENVWLVATGYRLDEVRDLLAVQLDPGDQLLVLDIQGQPWACAGIYPEAEAWLFDHVRGRDHA
jgi:hypothetical protein